MAHFSVKQRRPFKNSFCPSLRHRRQTASRCLANDISPLLLTTISFRITYPSCRSPTPIAVRCPRQANNTRRDPQSETRHAWRRADNQVRQAVIPLRPGFRGMRPRHGHTNKTKCPEPPGSWADPNALTSVPHRHCGDEIGEHTSELQSPYDLV